jgi:hypothetical protein
LRDILDGLGEVSVISKGSMGEETDGEETDDEVFTKVPLTCQQAEAVHTAPNVRIAKIPTPPKTALAPKHECKHENVIGKMIDVREASADTLLSEIVPVHKNKMEEVLDLHAATKAAHVELAKLLTTQD